MQKKDIRLLRLNRILLIFIVSILVLSGCFVNSDSITEDIKSKAITSTENYLINNYQNINSIEIEKVYRTPMGGLSVDGTVNGKTFFSIGINESDFTVGSIGGGEGFPERKEECKETTCDY